MNNNKYNSRKDDPFGGSGGAIQLDFPALPIYWKNGNARLPETAGVEHFGGWCSDAAKFENTVAELGIEPPAGWVKQTMRNDKGDEYEVYCARQVIFAPVRKRSAWFTARDGSKKSNSAVNVLGYMAVVDPKVKPEARTFIPWGFVVISAKSLTGKAVEDLLASWKSKVTPILRQTKDASQSLGDYYVSIGTFGKIATETHKSKSGGQSSTVTPCRLVVPDTITPEVIAKRYIGEGISAICAEAFTNSQEWADDWNKRDNRKPTTMDDGGDVQPEDNYGAENDIPF